MIARSVALASLLLASCSAAPPTPTVVVSAPAAATPSDAPSAAPASAATALQDARAAAIAADLANLDVAMIGVLGSDGPPANGGVVGGGVSGLRLGGGGGALRSGASAGGGGLAGLGTASASASAAPATGKVASVSVDGATLAGGPVANAQAVVAGMAAGFRRCLNKALAADPHAYKDGATLKVLAQIGKDGEVLSASPSGSGLPGTAIACIAARVASAQFAPPDGGSAALVIHVTAHVTP